MVVLYSSIDKAMFCMIDLSHFGKEFNTNLRLGSIGIDVIINIYVLHKWFLSLGMS
jgi:hypothetical protein